MTRKKIILKIIIDLLLTIVVAAAAWLLVSFFQKKITAISRKIQEKKIITYNLNNRDQNSAKISKELERLDKNWLAVVEAGLPYIDDTAPFVDSMESLRRKYGLSGSIELGAPELLPKTAGQLPIDRFAYKLVLTDGNLNTVINYLKDFERMQFFTGLNSLSFNSDDVKGINSKINANISGLLYVREQD